MSELEFVIEYMNSVGILLEGETMPLDLDYYNGLKTKIIAMTDSELEEFISVNYENPKYWSHGFSSERSFMIDCLESNEIFMEFKQLQDTLPELHSMVLFYTIWKTIEGVFRIID